MFEMWEKIVGLYSFLIFLKFFGNIIPIHLEREI